MDPITEVAEGVNRSLQRPGVSAEGRWMRRWKCRLVRRAWQIVQIKAKGNDEDDSNFPQEDSPLSHQLVIHECSTEPTALLTRLAPLAEHPEGHRISPWTRELRLCLPQAHLVGDERCLKSRGTGSLLVGVA